MKQKFIIAIDLGGTNLKIAILDLKYRVITKEVLSTSGFRGKNKLILVILRSVKGIIASCGLTAKDILGLGIGVPGPVDYQNGIVHFLPNIPGWKEIKLRDTLKARLRLPIFLDNDAKLMALAEYKLGKARGFRNALCITLGTGVGAGIIIDGQLFRAANNAAGEIGHLPINEKGPRCNCGGTACLEAYIGNNRIKAQAKKIFRRNISLEELSSLAKKNNHKALNIWRSVGTHLGVALSGVVNLLNLDAIIIGGGVANAGSILFKQIKNTIKERSMSVQAGHVKVFKAKLGKDAGLFGAAVLVREGLAK